MTDCNACTPQHLNPAGQNCRDVPTRFTVLGRGGPFVNIGPEERHFRVPYLKYGALQEYIVDYTPVQWSCNCPDFTRRLGRRLCCKHIIVCIDSVQPGYSGTVYPYVNYLNEHVFPVAAAAEATFRQMIPK